MSGTDDDEILWHTGLFARIDASFPKKCSNCGRVFATAEQYFVETEDLNSTNKGLKACAVDGTATVVEAFRNCPCGSTLMETFDDHREQLKAETARRRALDVDDVDDDSAAEGSTAGPWANAWHAGLCPNGQDTFPKECRSCGRVFETPDDFFHETDGIREDHSGLRETEDDDEQVVVEAFRNCPCGSTLMDSFSNRRDMSPAGRARRALFDRMLAFLVDSGLDAETARQELLTVARGGESTVLANIRPPDEADGDEDAAMNPMPASQLAGNEATRHERLVHALCVSPSEQTAGAAEACLARQPDIEFRWCAEPAEALAAAREFQPTVILMDLSPDAAGGLQRIRDFREDPDCRELPVIALLQGDDPDVRKSAFATGVSDALADPPDDVEWPSRIRYHSAAGEARRELARATDELEKARDQLIRSEKMASMGLLAAGVAHEINNPVAFVTSNLNSLGDCYREVFSALDAGAGTDARQELGDAFDVDMMREDVSQILAECQNGMSRVRTIVDNLSHFSRSCEDDWQHTDLHDELDRALNLAHNELKYKAEVIREFGDVPMVECIPSQLNQVFLNLLTNAGHAIEDKGQITITTARGGAPRERRSWQASGDDWVQVTIADTGAGMNEEIRARVFEPFFTTKDIGKGTGLGLPVSFGIIKKHGGDISVASEPGKGSVFAVCLPVTHEAG
jgi:signal transduction histidine kinase/ferredoxin